MATGALVLLLALAAAAAAAAAQNLRLGEFIRITPPQPAPQAGFFDLAGKPVRLADFAGRPAVVNLWATWCRPCLKELPSLDRLAARLGDRLTVAAVAEDRTAAARVARFAATVELRHLKVYLDPKTALERAFRVRALPTSVVLDAKGRVVGTVVGGAEWDSRRMLGVLEPLLKGKGAPPLKPAGG